MPRDEERDRRRRRERSEHERRERRRSRTVDPYARDAAAGASSSENPARRSRRRDSLAADAIDDAERENLRAERRRERTRDPDARRESRHGRDRERTRERGGGGGGGGGGERERPRDKDRDKEREKRHRAKKKAAAAAAAAAAAGVGVEEVRHGREGRSRSQKARERGATAATLEDGGTRLRGGGGDWDDGTDRQLLDEKERSSKFKKNKRYLYMLIAAAIVVVILIIVIPVVVIQQNNNDDDDSSSSSSDSANPNKSNLDGLDPSEVPTEWKNTYLDPWSWYDTSDFNVTFTAATVGDLPVMGLMSDWDDSAAPNSKAPALDDDWGSYGDRPARGVNLGGWLSLEPFITPSLFDYDSKLGIVDEYTLCKHLGASKCSSTLEKHYATFVSEGTFKAIADAGLDHVRIPYSYWAVEKYDGDPYLFRTSWRYLLRGIEWARKYGLRINLDLHGLPGSQNGWNHSGRWGIIGWLNGTDGDTNAQRSLDIHGRLSKFFAQDRYKNIISHYGLANEPKMTQLDVSAVLAWTQSAFDLVRSNGIDAVVVFGDGFMGLDNWQGKLTGNTNLALDVHQYVIFNADQITMTRTQKVQYACSGWSNQTDSSMDTATGYGPTLFAEWSQADTDCQLYVTNVGWGNRWTGTYTDYSAGGTSVLTPRCPTEDSQCTCGGPAGSTDVGTFSDGYKEFLLMFASAQMTSFERGWGWWYWTWQTESAPLWSYKAGLDAGILPKKAYERDFDCSGDIPSWSSVPEYE